MEDNFIFYAKNLSTKEFEYLENLNKDNLLIKLNHYFHNLNEEHLFILLNNGVYVSDSQFNCLVAESLKVNININFECF